jgi:hypothetical protein
VKRACVLVASVAVLASLAMTPGAKAALTAPELFVRAQPWDTHEPVGDWIPLVSAPAFDYVGGYQIGYRLQDSGQPNQFQRVALVVAAVPDGVPSQPSNSEPFCVGRAGTPGTIVDAAPELQFEGVGTYTVRVSLGSDAPGADCLTGPATTGFFSVQGHVDPVLAGQPFSFRATPPGAAFVGVGTTPAPPGGLADVRCALDAVVATDGSVSGSLVVPEGAEDPGQTVPSISEEELARPGAWTCVARGAAEALNADYDRVAFGTPWSSPLPVEVRSDFRRATGRLARHRAKHPRLTLTAEWPDASVGGRLKLTLLRVTGCKGADLRLRKVATYRGRLGPARVRMTLRRPRAGFYLGRLGFAGTHFIRASTDPRPVLLTVKHRRMSFVDPLAFPRC